MSSFRQLIPLWYQRRLAAMRVVRALTPSSGSGRAVAEHGQGSWFDIIEPGEGVGGPVWTARMAYEDVRTVHDQASLREQAARASCCVPRQGP
jgi:hypothetical protein